MKLLNWCKFWGKILYGIVIIMVTQNINQLYLNYVVDRNVFILY